MKNTLKKMTIASIMAAVVSGNAAFAAAGDFFLSAKAGASMLRKVKDHDTPSKMNSTNLAVGVGVGYYVADGFRVEVGFDQVLHPTLKKSYTADSGDPLIVSKMSVKHEVGIRDLLVRGYVNVLDLGSVAKLYVMGGAGIAQVRDTFYFNHILDGGPSAVVDSNMTYKAKKRNNFAWTVGFGVDANVYDNFHLSAGYDFRHYGKTKSLTEVTTNANPEKLSGVKLNTHNFVVGMRIDL